MSASQLGRKHPPEVKEKIGKANVGKHFGAVTPEHRKKLSVAGKGRKRSPESIAKTAAARRGMKHTPESIAKMSASHMGKGHPMSDKQKEFMRRILKGRVISEETKEKMRESSKRRWEKYAQEHPKVPKEPKWRFGMEFTDEMKSKMTPKQIKRRFGYITEAEVKLASQSAG